jgi:hypothetical protein
MQRQAEYGDSLWRSLALPTHPRIDCCPASWLAGLPVAQQLPQLAVLALHFIPLRFHKACHLRWGGKQKGCPAGMQGSKHNRVPVVLASHPLIGGSVQRRFRCMQHGLQLAPANRAGKDKLHSVAQHAGRMREGWQGGRQKQARTAGGLHMRAGRRRQGRPACWSPV